MTDHVVALTRPLAADITHAPHARRVAWLKQHGGHALSFCTMQPDMSYFDLPGIGYIAYAQYWGMRFALADPVCAPEQHAALLDGFLARYPDAVFVQVTRAVVAPVHARPCYDGTQFGSAAQLAIQSSSLYILSS